MNLQEKQNLIQAIKSTNLTDDAKAKVVNALKVAYVFDSENVKDETQALQYILQAKANEPNNTPLDEDPYFSFDEEH